MSLHLFRKRSIWLPTWRLTAILLVLGAGFFFGAFRFLYPLLAASHPLERPEVVVVDGWVSDETMREAVALGGGEWCRAILVAGVDLTSGSYLSEYGSYARLGEATLEAMGVPADRVHAAPAGSRPRHRSFASAAAVHGWLKREGLLGSRILVLTEGPHGRRTRILYGKVFRDAGSEIGVLSAPPLSYDPEAWWKTSAGVKAVIVELLALMDEWLRDGGRATNDPGSVVTDVSPAPPAESAPRAAD